MTRETGAPSDSIGQSLLAEFQRLTLDEKTSTAPPGETYGKPLDQPLHGAGVCLAPLLRLGAVPAAKARPVFVFVHGGSWKQGDKAQAEPMATPIVARGYVFASANYRLLPDSQFPENAEDVAAAVAWLHQHAAEFGGDAKRIFLAGHSAGAHLAALVGTDAR